MSEDILSIGVSRNGGAQVFSLSGDLDSFTCGRLSSVSETAFPGVKKVVVNLDNLDYIDSSGLSALVRLWITANNNGARMLVSCRNPRIHRVLAITGLDKFFTMAESDERESESVSMRTRQTGLGRIDKTVPKSTLHIRPD